MKKAYKKHLKYMALIWAGCFILFFFVYLIVLAPQYKTEKQVGTRLAKIQKQYNDVQTAAQINNRNELRKQTEDVQEKVDDFIINFEDSANLTFDISQMADSQKLTTLSIKTKGSKPIPDCEYISKNQINLSFNAGFNQFFALLNALERHRPVVFIDKFAITRSAKPYSGNEASMELTVFVTKRSERPKSNSG